MSPCNDPLRSTHSCTGLHHCYSLQSDATLLLKQDWWHGLRSRKMFSIRGMSNRGNNFKKKVVDDQNSGLARLVFRQNKITRKLFARTREAMLSHQDFWNCKHEWWTVMSFVNRSLKASFGPGTNCNQTFSKNLSNLFIKTQNVFQIPGQNCHKEVRLIVSPVSNSTERPAWIALDTAQIPRL